MGPVKRQCDEDAVANRQILSNDIKKHTRFLVRTVGLLVVTAAAILRMKPDTLGKILQREQARRKADPVSTIYDDGDAASAEYLKKKLRADKVLQFVFIETKSNFEMLVFPDPNNTNSAAHLE